MQTRMREAAFHHGHLPASGIRRATENDLLKIGMRLQIITATWNEYQFPSKWGHHNAGAAQLLMVCGAVEKNLTVEDRGLNIGSPKLNRNSASIATRGVPWPWRDDVWYRWYWTQLESIFVLTQFWDAASWSAARIVSAFCVPRIWRHFFIASPPMSVPDGHVHLRDVAFDFLAARYKPARHICMQAKRQRSCCSKAKGPCVHSSALMVWTFIDRMSQHRRNPVCWFHVDGQNCLGVVIRVRGTFSADLNVRWFFPYLQGSDFRRKNIPHYLFEVSDAVLSPDSFATSVRHALMPSFQPFSKKRQREVLCSIQFIDGSKIQVLQNMGCQRHFTVYMHRSQPPKGNTTSKRLMVWMHLLATRMEVTNCILNFVYKLWSRRCLEQHWKLASYIANLSDNRWLKREMPGTTLEISKLHCQPFR